MGLCLVRNPAGGISIENTGYGAEVCDGRLRFGHHDLGEVLKVLDTSDMIEAIQEAEELRLLYKVMET